MNNIDNSITKFKEIIDWYRTNADEDINHLNTNTNTTQLQQIEQITDSKLPDSFNNLYKYFDGEDGDKSGVFLGHQFLSLNGILNKLEFAKTQIKPTERIVNYPAASEVVIRRIIKALDLVNKLSNTHQWHRLTFLCSPNSLAGPYIYPNSTSTGKEKKSYHLDNEAKFSIMDMVQELHDIELKKYNWDELEFTIFSDGNYQVNRSDFNLSEELPLTSFPEQAIKLKYFHIKWIPIFSDYGGNFIGIDLDPDINGKFGQVIIFGRDEEDMFVLADDLEAFFDRCISVIKNEDKQLLGEDHLHDLFRSKIK